MIRFRDFIAPTAVIDELEAQSKNELLVTMVDVLVATGQVRQETRKGILKALQEREKLGSTGIGQSVAIPHAKHPSIKKIVGVLGRSREGVEFDALDGKPVHLFFLVISNQNSPSDHLECLAYISKYLRDDNFRRFLLNARDKAEIIELLAEADENSLIKD
ncbi:MAG: PTS sugar transporter subunit IIA [Planctomycetes bacterium]|nr:PTS sugar transporter subunit IIA [Planctomycetota bacterium]